MWQGIKSGVGWCGVDSSNGRNLTRNFCTLNSPFASGVLMGSVVLPCPGLLRELLLESVGKGWMWKVRKGPVQCGRLGMVILEGEEGSGVKVRE